MDEMSTLVRSKEGLISRRIFYDAEIYKNELARVFGRCWLFLGHESQVRNNGDYLTAYMGEDPIIVCRGSDGKVRAFLNSCRHRGMKVCRADRGNTTEFQCSFHGWTYSNTGELLGVPFFREAYAGALDKSKYGLYAVPRVQSYGGLIFGCWDQSAPSLDEYLGDLRWYFDVLLQRHIGGLEFIPGQQRYKLAANWKIASENFVGDNYHLHHSHGSLYQLDIRPINPVTPALYRKPVVYHNLSFDRGHGLNGVILKGARYETDRLMAQEMGPEVVEYVEECHNRLKKLSSEQAQIHALSFGNIFPNFSFNDFSVLRPVGIYVWHPRGPSLMEAWQWCAIDAAAPKAVKEICRVDFARVQAVTGIAAQDDSENFEQVTEAARGFVGQTLDFNYQMNVGPPGGSAMEGYPGRFAPYLSEVNQNNFYSYWASLMS